MDFSCHFLTPKTKSGFGVKVQHLINLKLGTYLLSLPYFLTEVWPKLKKHNLKTSIIIYSIRFTFSEFGRHFSPDSEAQYSLIFHFLSLVYFTKQSLKI